LELDRRRMPGGDECCTRTPHLEGEEVFVSLKRKPDTVFGDERESHMPDKISISRPRVQTRSARLNDSPPPVTTPDSLTTPNSPTTSDEEQPQLPTHDALQRVDRHHFTAIEETLCNYAQWHIARLPKISAKACFVLQAITKKKCVARIVQDGKSTAAPTYSGLMDNYRKKRLDPQDFFFCNDDIEKCIKGTKRRWVVSVPNVPEVWPIKSGTNLTYKEILSLENAGFRLPQQKEMTPSRIF
jgi:hypothetical protein